MQESGKQKKDGPHWYVLYLRSRFEKKVHEELQRRGVESFLPMVREIKQWSDRKKKVEVPLFPGYDFVWIDLKQRVRVLQVDGVVRLVGTGSQPTPVPDEQIHALMVVVSMPETLRKESTIPNGQMVEVTGGPFRGIRGIVVRGQGKTRVLIAVDTIEQAVSVEVPTAWLREVGVEDTISNPIGIT